MIEPKFKNPSDYEKAQLLMQPIFIRLIDNIRKQSELLTWVVEYQQGETLADGYFVTLKKDGFEITKNLWELCFDVCFLNYQSSSDLVEIDHSLLEDDQELDWLAIDTKTKLLVEKLLIIQHI